MRETTESLLRRRSVHSVNGETARYINRRNTFQKRWVGNLRESHLIQYENLLCHIYCGMYN